MKLSQLHPNEGQIAGVPKNPRTITDKEFKALTKSLKNFRKMLPLRPIVVDEDYNILGGNMRYLALVKLAEDHAKIGAFEFTDEIPDEWVKQDCTLTEKEKREFVLKDNKDRGEWDMDILANEFEIEELKEWDMDLVAFDEEKLNGLFDEGTEENIKTKDTFSVQVPAALFDKMDEIKAKITECIKEYAGVKIL